jgi:hypothetical protein
MLAHGLDRSFAPAACGDNIRKQEAIMAGPELKLDGDGQNVTATFPTNPPVSMKLSTADIEATLKILGSLREQMQPEVPDAMADGDEPVADPVWETAPDEPQQNALLRIRDPRYGWLLYAIPNEEAKKLAEYLQPE